MIKKIIYFTIIGMFLTIVSNANATILKNINLDELIQGSGRIIKGEVVLIEETYINNKIKTIYTICDIEDLNGQPSNECIEIEMMGSASEPFIINLPYLEQNKIYILFLRESKNYFSPFYGWQQGIFEVNKNNENSITNYRGLPVLGFSESNNDFEIGGQSEETFVYDQEDNYIYNLENYAISYDEFKIIINNKITKNKDNHSYVPQGLPRNQRPFQSGDVIRNAQ